MKVVHGGQESEREREREREREHFERRALDKNM